MSGFAAAGREMIAVVRTRYTFHPPLTFANSTGTPQFEPGAEHVVGMCGYTGREGRGPLRFGVKLCEAPGYDIMRYQLCFAGALSASLEVGMYVVWWYRCPGGSRYLAIR